MNGATSLGALRITGIFDPPAIAKDLLPEGVIVRMDKVTANYENHDIRLPQVIEDEYCPGITVEGGGPTAGSGVPTSENPDPVDIQVLGLGRVMLAANKAVLPGDSIDAANTSGHAKARTRWGYSGSVLGYSYQKKTTGASPLPVEVLMLPHYVEIVMPIVGGTDGTGTIGAGATKYLAAPGVAPASAHVPLFIARYAGKLRHLAASLKTAPAAGEGVAFMVMKSSDNGATWSVTTLTCTISDANKSASDLDETHAVDVAAGDLVAIRVIGSNNGGFLGAGPTATLSFT